MGGFGGADASASRRALGLGTYGFGHQISASNRVADDFTVTGRSPWTDQHHHLLRLPDRLDDHLDHHDVHLQIWDGPPDDRVSIVVFGDLVTNRLASSTWSQHLPRARGHYPDRQRPPDHGQRGDDRHDPACRAPTGSTGSPAARSPPVRGRHPSRCSASTGTGNALQSLAAAPFAPIIDLGPQDLPFVIEGSASACDTPSNLPWVSVNPAAGTTAPAATTVVDVTFDSTGLLPGLYEGLLCVNSNDPDTPLVEVPVALTVDSMPFLDGFETGDASRWSVSVGLP